MKQRIFSLIFLAIFLLCIRFSVPLILRQTGVIKDIIPISGTGSMYPTFPKGVSLTDTERSEETVAQVPMLVYPGGITFGTYSFFSYHIKHGDIISFENDATKKISQEKYNETNGFVKRVIGVPGDRIEIREGFVILNGELQKEPYTVRPRGTFGGDFLPDCQTLRIPTDSVFVMGDNRVASNDSRHDIGLVKLFDIDHVLPLSQQIPFENNWRDPSDDVAHRNEPTFNVNDFVTLLNQKRTENGLNVLRFDNQLARSAHLRGVRMLEANDLSFEGTRSGYTMQQALRDVGYRNGLFGESSQLGYLSSNEIFESSFEFPETSEFLLNPDHDDIGISVIQGDLNGCPAQLIVEHFGGYVPPNYSKEEIDSWQKLFDSLNSVFPSWDTARSNEQFYQEHKNDLDQIISLFNRRRDIAQIILSRMQKQEWLTYEEENLISEDERLAKELNELIEKIQ